MLFRVDNNLPMTILSSGNVGIGTTSPDTRLYVSAASAIVNTNVLTISGGFSGFNGNNDANIQHGLLFNLCSYSVSTGSLLKEAAKIEVKKVGSWNEAAGGSGTKADIVFSTNNGTIASPAMTERMRITSTGEIKVKPATSGRAFFSTQDPGNFSIAYTAYMVNASTKVLDVLWYGSTIGSISVNASGNGVNYNTTSSDERLKKNITNWDENILDKFKDIKPKEFHFNTQNDSEEKIKGYIAQNEVDKFPEAYPLVYNEEVEEDRHLFNPSGMVVYLMKAIQELKADNDSLKARIETLENN
tara:strand:- start:957 stop:1859 length:903 start_codon:yes stop_codon:yes gene_type:complete